MPKRAKPPLALVSNPSIDCPQPPRKLGAHGLNLWRRIMAEYDIRDSGGVELLTLACQSLDRAEGLRSRIDADGELIRGREGLKDHPALKHELSARAFVARCLARLNLDVEPLRSTPGRPSGHPITDWER
jgi:hypothetical protein